MERLVDLLVQWPRWIIPCSIKLGGLRVTFQKKAVMDEYDRLLEAKLRQHPRSLVANIWRLN
jgi:hypothetical protein